MKITCDKCNALYDVDDRRIPPEGLTMKCPRCLASFTVKPAGTPSSFDGDWDIPDAPPAPPPRPAGGKYYLRRRTGKVFGPFLEKAIASMLEQGKLDGDEDLSLDGQGWQPLGSIPSLAPYARAKASAGARTAPGGHDGGMDLPAPRGAVLPEVVDLPGLPGEGGAISDLPAPRGAMRPGSPPPRSQPRSPSPPPSAGLSLQEFDQNPGPDLGEFDLGGDDLAELPAPKGALRAPPRPPPPPVGQEIVDLPAPKGGRGIADLPAPRGAPPPPPPRRATGLENGQLDLGGDDLAELPIPKGDILDLPAPKAPGISDLPAPKGHRVAPPPPPMGVVDLLAPKDGVTGLLAPKDGVTGLLDPRDGGVTGLLEPRDGVTGLRDPRDGGVTGLLEPRDGVTGLPVPKGTGLEYGQIEFGGGSPIGELDDLPVSAGKAVGLDLDLPAPKGEVRSTPLDAPDLLTPKADAPAAIVDVVAPKGPKRPFQEEEAEEIDEGDVVRFEVPRGARPQPVEEVPIEEAVEEEVGAPKPRPRTTLFVGGAIGAVILVAGIILGLVTDYGFFGLNLFTGSHGKTTAGKKQLAAAREALLKDTSQGYALAATDFESAAKNLGEIEHRALAAQAIAAMAYRFDPQKRADAEAILQKLQKEELKSPLVDKARALTALAGGGAVEAIAILKPLSDKEPADFLAALYLGWAQLPTDPAAAQASLNRALAAKASLPGALFGLAESYRALKDPAKAEAFLDKTLLASPAHSSALLRKVEGHLREHRVAQAQAVLKQILALGSAGREMALAQSFLGDLAAREGQNRQARDHYGKAIRIYSRTLNAYLGLGALNHGARRYDEALATYKQAQAIDPAELRVSLGMATSLLALSKPLDARKALQDAAKTSPEAPEVLYLQGLIEETVGNLAPAERFYQSTIKKNPTYFEAYRHLCLIYVQQKKIDEALKVLVEADSKIPSSPLVRAAQGEVFYAAKKLELAQAKLEEALRLDANLNSAIFLLASVLAERGKFEEAKVKLLQLKGKDAEYPGLSAKLGSTYGSLKEYAKAATEYDNALKVDPPIEVRLAAGKAYLLAGQPEKALIQSAKVLELEPTRHPARAIRAQARLAEGKPDEALIEIQQAIERENAAEYHVILGRVQEARNQIADAIDAYTAALKADPSLIEVRLRRGVLLVQTGTVREGLKELQSVIKANPDLPEAYFYMGNAHADLQQEAQALASYRIAVAKDPKLGAAHFKIAQIHNDNQRKAEAIPSFEAAIKAGAATPSASWLPEAYFLYGNILFERGQKKQAIEAYTGFLKVAPARSAVRGDVEKKLRDLGVDPKAALEPKAPEPKAPEPKAPPKAP